MSGVTLQNITKRYNKTVVVEDVNLEIKPGEFIVLVGPSGCGKSTTLRMVAGLEEPSDGKIMIGDHDVTNKEPKDRDIAMVFQDYALYPHMTVEENMAFGLKLRKQSKDYIKEQVNNAADILHISHLLGRYPKELSGGQRQRVALGRAIVRHPQVFLMDEPLSNLDAKLRVKMRSEIVRIQKRLSTTTIYVTHDQIEAMTMGDRIVVMKDGLVQQVGSPREIYNQPTNMFVAGFLGSPNMNFLEGKVTNEGGRFIFTAPGITLPLNNKQVSAKSEKVVLGIRPEHISVAAQTGSNWSQGIAGTVEMMEDLGSEKVVFFKMQEQEVQIKVTDVSHMQDLDKKTAIYLDMDRSYLFDKESGERIDQ